MNSVTSICNMALSVVGAKRINDYNTGTSLGAIQCRLFYEPARDALLRSYWWGFASDRATLSQDTNDPDFEWDNQFILPSDFLRLKSVYEEVGYNSRSSRHAIEGQRILTNESTQNIRYIKRVTDVTKFDPLFVKVLVFLLADDFVGPLAGGDKRIQEKIDRKLAKLMLKVSAVNDNETDTGGRSDWNLARHGGLGVAGEDERYW